MIDITKCNCGKVKIQDKWISPLDFIRKIIQLRNEEKIDNVNLVDEKCDTCNADLEHARRACGGNYD